MKRLIFLLAITLFGIQAYTTPPRVFNSDDVLFAASASHIYVLRELSDNSGSYYTDRRDIYLVEIAIPSGDYVNHWAVSSSIAYSVDAFPGEVTYLEPQTPFVNPYEIVRDRGANLTSEYPPYQGFGYKIKNGSLITNYGDPTGASGAKTYFDKDQLLALAQDVFAPVFETYEPLEDSQIRDMAGNYMWVPSLEQMNDCTVEAREMNIGQWGNGYIPIKIRCGIYEDEPNMGGVSFYVFVPD